MIAVVSNDCFFLSVWLFLEKFVGRICALARQGSTETCWYRILSRRYVSRGLYAGSSRTDHSRVDVGETATEKGLGVSTSSQSVSTLFQVEHFYKTLGTHRTSHICLSSISDHSCSSHSLGDNNSLIGGRKIFWRKKNRKKLNRFLIE